MAKLKTKGYKWTPLTPCGVNPPTESLIEVWITDTQPLQMENTK